MLRYPYAVYSRKIRLAPLFTDLQGEPFPIDLSVSNRILADIDVRDQKSFQSLLERQMAPDFTWGLGGYLERRDTLLRDCPQMVTEGRYYHLGVDIAVPLDTALHAPLEALVTASGYEEGEGNYGGYILLKHPGGANFDSFYSFYGHLNPYSTAPVSTRLKAGEPFARVGDFHENGNWYYHTHMQIITESGLKAGYLHKGYCAEKEIGGIFALCPDPLPLLVV